MNSKKKRKKVNINDFFKIPQHYLAFKVYSKYNNLPGMYRNLKKLEPIYKRKPSFYYRLSKLAYRQQLWEQSLNYINTAIELAEEGSSTEYSLSKANCLIKMREPSKAISFLNDYLLYKPNDTRAWCKRGIEYTKTRQWQGAIDSFEKCLAIQPKDPEVNYQLGEVYYQINETKLAEIHYLKATENIDQNSTDNKLVLAYYKLGLMQLKNGKSKLAAKTFTETINLDQELNSQRWGIGVFHERFNEWEYAVEAYENQLRQQNDQDAELYFKIGSMLDKISQPQQAVDYYEKALSLNKVQSRWHYMLANCYEQLEDYESAAIWYKSAIIRQQNHSSLNYRRLGFVLGKIGKTKEALESYEEAELFRRPSNVRKNFFQKKVKNAEVRYAISYNHYSVNNKMVFYESLGGARVMGNPYAVFESIYQNSDFVDYIHVWVVGSFSVVPEELRALDNVIFVKKGSDAYFRYISSAKYLICNSTFADYVTRKPEQLYLQTSHGIFYKTVGRDSTGSPIGVAGSTRNLLQATHIIVPNDFMAEKQLSSYSIQGVNAGQIAKIGYPRIDVTLNASDILKNEIKLRLGLKASRKSVLYAPTWRGSSKTSNRFDSNKLIEDLKLLAGLDVDIIFRGHTISNKLLKGVKFPDNIILPPPDIQTNELLSIADILITDYSSVFFDFIPTERPIIHYLYDLEEYTRERGLNLTEDELPGTVVKTSEELVKSITDGLVNTKPSLRYLSAKERFCPYDDGHSAERVVRWFFNDDKRDLEFVDQEEGKNSILCLGGMLGDESEIANLVSRLNKLDDENNTVSIMLKKRLSHDKEKLSALKKLNPNINFIAHAGNMPMTLEEAVAINYYNSNGKFISKRMQQMYKQAFRREARRLFGDSHFDKVINYEKDSNYWNGLSQVIQ